MPKLTLFNKKYDDTVTRIIENETEGNEKKIRFVKPKAIDEELENQIKTAKKVEQSRLAVLLKCLAGELEDESEDMVDTGKKEEKPEPSINVTPQMPTLLKEAPVIEIPSLPVQPVLPTVPENKQEEQKKEEETLQKTEKPVVSFNLPQSTTVPTLVQPSVPKPMFSFGASTTTTVAASTTPAVTNSISVITSMPSSVSSPPKTTSNDTINASFLFGNISNAEALPKALISAPTSAFTATGTGLQSSFNFGTNNSQAAQSVAPASITTTTTNNTTNVQASQVTKMPSFGFGGLSSGNNEMKTGLPAFGAVTASTVGNSIIPGKFFFCL